LMTEGEWIQIVLLLIGLGLIITLLAVVVRPGGRAFCPVCGDVERVASAAYCGRCGTRLPGPEETID
jgi:hypothetical protein